MRLLLPLLLCAAAGYAQQAVTLLYDASQPPVRFAASEIRKAWAARGVSVVEGPCCTAAGSGRTIVLEVNHGASEYKEAQSYSIIHAGNRWHAAALDAAGAMYAGLDIAEAIRIGTFDNLPSASHRPHVARRGIKFNIPLDARTPSYSDNSDSAQNNIPEMWSMDFWREMLDEMARNRYNLLSLWSLHPFPSMVKVPEYPDVALDDVMRTTHPLDDTYSHNGVDMVRPEILANLQLVKKMSMGEKIQFWRDVMQYAQDRGIGVYVVTWNIFTFGAEGKYGITKAQDNPKTIDYFRRSVREMVLTYPLLAGIGITAGEQMQERKDQYSKEKWLWAAYGEGIRDALKVQPGREVKLIHRFHQTAFGEILNEWREYPGPFEFSYKYAVAHMYSMPNPVFVKDLIPHLNPGVKTWLTVRNDDIYSFRWADPDFARDFVNAMPDASKLAGFYMGPDGYNWGREFIDKEPETPRQLVMQKQWLSFLLWGRLSFNPQLANSHFEKIVAARFPGADVAKLMRGWQSASRVMPEITRFSWGDIDLKWYPEANLSHRRYRGWFTVRHYIEGITMPGSGNLDILAWRAGVLAGKPAEGKTPHAVAAALDQHADGALAVVKDMKAGAAGNKELRLTLGDIEAMALLGRYYASKIRGSAELAMFDATGKPEQKSKAVAELEAALGHWRAYAAVYSSQYKPQLLNRIGFVDMTALAGKAEEDVAMAKAWQQGTIKDESGKPKGRDTLFRQ